jgi:hypothetical protein
MKEASIHNHINFPQGGMAHQMQEKILFTLSLEIPQF